MLLGREASNQQTNIANGALVLARDGKRSNIRCSDHIPVVFFLWRELMHCKYDLQRNSTVPPLTSYNLEGQGVMIGAGIPHNQTV